MSKVPEPLRKSVLVNYRATPQEKAALERFAAARDQTLSDLIRDSLRSIGALPLSQAA